MTAFSGRSRSPPSLSVTPRLTAMATWEDGPEYAPLERPDAFTEPAPSTVGLEAPPAPPVPAPPPVERPVFAESTQPAPPLEELVPEPPAQRNPKEPFDVATTVMTAESSAWAAAHWSRPNSNAAPITPSAPVVRPAQPTVFALSTSLDRSALGGGAHGGPETNGASHTGGSVFPPPSGSPAFPASYPSVVSGASVPTASNGFPVPGESAGPNGSAHWGGPAAPPGHPVPYGSGGQPFPPPGRPSDNGPFPAPGTPSWFAPGAYPPSPPRPTTPDARAVLAAATPGVLICLVIGGFIWVLAPITLLLAFVLSGRMTYGRTVTRTAFAAVLAFLGLVGLLSLVTADGLFSVWWDILAGWACFTSWVMLAITGIASYRALRQGRPDPPRIPRGSSG